MAQTTRVPGRFTRCRVGVAVRDVTPPVGIYHRAWGAATYDVAEGVHRPCLATAAVMLPIEGEVAGVAGGALALVALDVGWFGVERDERALREAVLARTGLDPAALLINLSHSHAVANAASSLADRPGGEHIGPYLARLADAVSAAVIEARARAVPAWVSWGQGRCNLAVNRDYRDEARGRWACGYNPDSPADDTVLVGRATADDGSTLATFVNYACHPTTLAWDNRLISPDYIGATREVVEQAFAAPMLFLQGASGELGPREGYVGDTAVADRNGRQLGYAAASAIEALAPPDRSFVYGGLVESGAVLGVWGWEPTTATERDGSQALAARCDVLELPRKPMRSVAELRAELATATEFYQRERLTRLILIAEGLGAEPTYRLPIWSWRLGQAGLVALAGEPYSCFQTTVRTHAAGTPLLVLGVTNGGIGYLCPAENDGTGLYQEIQSPFQPGCLERATQTAATALGAVLLTTS